MEKMFLLFSQWKRYGALVIIFFCLHLSSFAQSQQAISGTVVDADAKPLPGVSVLVEGTNLGTQTDGDGKYAIQASKGAVLIFSIIGYNQAKMVVADQQVIDVSMESSTQGLKEVVVVGYGTQRKRDITTAVSVIDAKKLEDIPASNMTRLLQGQAAGVSVKQTTGAPGQEFEVTVRGLSSLGAGSAPLYVIDGFPVGTSVGQNLNPNDIGTITILKDAASTAIYGARGSNGVVLITTKTATEGALNLTFSANYGIQNIPGSRKTKVLNGVEFAQFKKDAFIDKIRYFENREPAIEEIPLDYRFPEQTKVSTNWFDAILNQNAPFQNYDITLTNGKGPIQSMVSIGYIGQEGALIKTNYEGYSFRSNVTGKINEFITLGFNLNGTYSKQRVASTNGRDAIVGSSLIMDPRDPIYNDDGTYDNYIGGHDGVFGFPNPVQTLTEINKHREIGDILANGYLEFSFLKDFKFKSSVNVQLKNNAYKEYIPSNIAGQNAPPPRPATEYDESFRTRNLSADQLLTYSPTIGDSHSLDVLVGYTAQNELVKGLSGSGNDFPDDFVPYLDAAIIKTAGSTEYGWSTLATFGRVNYAFKDKYLFSGTFRREGSSRFGANNKWGNFPAASLGWRISEESFMPKVSWLNDLKLRASYGVTGNNNIGNYSSLSFMNINNYIIGNNLVSGKVISSFANANLGWEKSNQLDFGLDIAAFKNRLVFTFEYYRKITNDMLLPIQLPSISGFTTSLSNIGKVENKGLELAVDYNTKVNEFNLRTNFNISFNRNKVLAINGVNDEIWSGDMYGDYNVSKPGRPIGMIYGFKNIGVFNNQAEIDASPTQEGAIPGVYKYLDADGNGEVSYDTKDMVEIGNPNPEFSWAWTLGGDYKKFDLSVLFLGVQGYDLFHQIEKSTMNLDGVFNVLTDSKNRWRSEQNPGNGRITGTNTWKWQRESNSIYVYDASHMWVKNITLGYTLPKLNAALGNLRIFLSADNLFLITKYPGNNPDINMIGGTRPGMDDEAYPVARTFSAGAKLTF